MEKTATSKPLWQRPQLRADEEEQKERKASWLQLFLDLIFVAVVSVLAHGLAEEQSISWHEVGKFCLLFIPIWWIWMGLTFYNERFETDDISHRLCTFATMLPLAGMAWSAHHALDKTSDEFALSYVAARVILILMWFRGGAHSPAARPMTHRFVLGFSASVACWLVSLLVPAPARFGLWGLGLLIDLLTPLTTMGAEAQLPKLSTSHLPERFGLFILIVLGESVAGVVNGLGHSKSLHLHSVLLGMLGLILSFSLWWIYFDHIMNRRTKPSIWWTLGWAYAHLVLAMGLVALGAAVRNVIAHEGDVLSDSVRWLVCGAIVVSLVALAVVELTLEHSSGTPTYAHQMALLRFGTAGAVLLLAWVAAELDSIAFFGLLVGAAVLQVIHGLFRQIDGGLLHPHHAPQLPTGDGPAPS
jgi:low temperature requirement protein LtrA